MKNKNLLSISGRIGSGKDTIASMIQYLTDDRVQKNYKDFFKLSESIVDSYSDYRIMKFAGKLKQVASLLTGIPVEKFEDQEFKKTILDSCWSSYTPAIIHNDETVSPGKEVGMTVREFLQKLGTEGLRNGLHENVWVNALFADYENPECYSDLGSLSQNYVYPKWIITDTRFPNELEAVKERNGITIRLTRNSNVESNHESETALDNAKFDWVIDNQNQSLEETFEEVVRLVKHYDL